MSGFIKIRGHFKDEICWQKGTNSYNVFIHALVQGMLKYVIGNCIPIYQRICFSLSLTDNTVQNLLSEVMWTRQGQRFWPLCKLAIVHECHYNMYAQLFLVSVLFEDWRFQKEFFNQCAGLCLLWMCNCWWFDISLCTMIHMFMLGFTGGLWSISLLLFSNFIHHLTFYIDLLAFFSVFVCMLNSSHSTNVFIVPFKS